MLWEKANPKRLEVQKLGYQAEVRTVNLVNKIPGVQSRFGNSENNFKLITNINPTLLLNIIKLHI
jgi:hypothetical protein